MITLKEVTLIRAPIARCFDLARSVEEHLAGNVHWGEAAVAEGGITSGLVGLGQSVTWRAKHFATWFSLRCPTACPWEPLSRHVPARGHAVTLWSRDPRRVPYKATRYCDTAMVTFG